MPRRAGLGWCADRVEVVNFATFAPPSELACLKLRTLQLSVRADLHQIDDH